MMYKIIAITLATLVATYAAEISSAAQLDKTGGKSDLKIEDIETHAVFKKDNKPESEHPIYKEDRMHDARANIRPVRPSVSDIKHDLLADQPTGEVNRIDNLPMPGYGFVPSGPSEVAYPDIPYAPAYGYDSNHAASNGYAYDVYGNGPSNYALEDNSFSGLLWSQVPDSRTIVSYMGRTIVWMINSIFVLLIGSFLTIAFCSYTNLCSITFNGVGPIHEEMRSLVTPERLEKISHAADFVKTAIDKYQKIQKVTDITMRKRRAAFYRV